MHLIDLPLLFFIVSFALLWGSARVGLWMRRRHGEIGSPERDDLTLALSSVVTLLALIIGFSFSMAVARYDLRKTDEATEANAIGTEYARLVTLDATRAADARRLMKVYVGERIAWYEPRDGGQLQKVEAATRDTQNRMWSIVAGAAREEQTPVRAMVAVGMNEVIDSQGFSSSAWLNRIPIAAWLLMGAIAVCAAAMMGYTTRSPGPRWFIVFPLIIALSFFLIADLDSARRGVIPVLPENIIATQASLQ